MTGSTGSAVLTGSTVPQVRRLRGQRNWSSGHAAEDIVARRYEAAGSPVLDRRWRGQGGEIDLVAREGDALVFVEVKKARSHDEAAWRLGARQIARLCAAAAEYLAGEPRGQDSEMRFDLALVDNRGAVQVIENAFMAA